MNIAVPIRLNLSPWSSPLREAKQTVESKGPYALTDSSPQGGPMDLAALFFQFGPTSVEVIQRVLSRVQRGLRAY